MVDTINKGKLVPNPMSVQEMYSHALSREVVDLVKSGKYFTECEVEPLVRQWIQAIKEEHRPSVTSVTMDAKRTLWSLSRL